MAKLSLGVRIPEKRFGHVVLENVDFDKPVSYLKEKVSKKIDFPKDEIELIYCGSILEDNENIKALNVEPDATIHVFKKTKKPEVYTSTKVYTDEDCQKIAELFGTVTGTQISVTTRINILQKIISEYPEFRWNLGAQALIRDSVLFHSLAKVDVIKKVAQNYSIICDAAEFIVKTTTREIAKTEFLKMLLLSQVEESSTSSSEEENSTASTSEQARIRRISRDQLAAALMLAGSASLNSLSNIAQRNANLEEEQQTQQHHQNPTSSSSSTPARITPSIFSNALNQALLSTSNSRPESDQCTNTARAPNVEGSGDDSCRSQAEKFSNELQLMKEMGLADENLNLQALILSNGEVEAAVNLVLGGMNTIFN